MPGPKPASVVTVSRCHRKLLKLLVRRANSRSAAQLGIDRATVRLWRSRWPAVAAQLDAAILDGARRRPLLRLLAAALADAPRPGAPDTFTAEQRVTMIALSCEPPARSGRPVSHWTAAELAAEVVKRQIVATISPRTIQRLWAEAQLKPHRKIRWPLLPRCGWCAACIGRRWP